MDHVSPILLLLVQVGAIMALARVMGLLFARVGQPQVVGEMVAGIMLGPSLLGLLYPHAYAALFPKESVALLEVLSQFGVIFFLFLIGLEFDPKLVRSRGKAAAVIAVSSIAVPFALGLGLALFLYHRSDLFTGAAAASPLASGLFMGAAVAVTAFPVLARILTERNLHRTLVGQIAIACAAVNDVVAWCLLAFVVAIAKSKGATSGLSTGFQAAIYLGVMLIAVRPFLWRLQAYYDRQGRLSQAVVAVIFLLLLGSAAATEWIGIHAMFGAFVLGMIMPKATRFVRHLSEKLEDFTVVFLLPIFFAYAGLKTNLSFLSQGSALGYTLLILAVAVAGKLVGSAAAARASGIPWHQATTIGVLMNTRGLMELVILNIGRELGVISETLFGMMVIMALVTTAMTTPLLAVVAPRRLFDKPIPGDATAKRADRQPGQFSVLIPVSLPRSAKPLVQLADVIAAPRSETGKISALYLRPPAEHEAYRTGLDEATEATTPEPLRAIVAEAAARDVPVEPISFATRDVAGAISSVAFSWKSDLILMGFHNPVIGRSLLGGTVHRILTNAHTDVAVFVDRGLKDLASEHPHAAAEGQPAPASSALRLLVPYLGGTHDRFALELARRIARHIHCPVTVLHVVTTGRTGGTQDVKGVVEGTFTDPETRARVEFVAIESTDPIATVLERSKAFDLVLIGVEESWGLESHLFGFQPERIARDCPTSLLIVRKYVGAGRGEFVGG